jgi:hypothetical protein
MARAGIADQDAEGRWVDFHSLRYTFCRLTAEVLPIQVVKRLMRHSTLQLTADLYGELGIEDVTREVWSLPPILPKVDQEKNSGLLGGLLGENGEVTK